MLAVYDLLDGNGYKSEWLLKKIVKTPEYFNVDFFYPTTTSIRFKVVNQSKDASIEYFNIIDIDSNEVIRKIEDPSVREITDLVSGKMYRIEMVYTYKLGDKIVTDSKIFVASTEKKQEPKIVFQNPKITNNSISADLEIHHPNTISNIQSIELYKNDELIGTNPELIVDFNNLDSYTDYLIKVIYSYDFNDGKGVFEKV